MGYQIPSEFGKEGLPAGIFPFVTRGNYTHNRSDQLERRSSAFSQYALSKQFIKIPFRRKLLLIISSKSFPPKWFPLLLPLISQFEGKHLQLLLRGH
jgi:hypothetical protein